MIGNSPGTKRTNSWSMRNAGFGCHLFAIMTHCEILHFAFWKHFYLFVNTKKVMPLYRLQPTASTKKVIECRPMHFELTNYRVYFVIQIFTLCHNNPFLFCSSQNHETCGWGLKAEFQANWTIFFFKEANEWNLYTILFCVNKGNYRYLT